MFSMKRVQVAVLFLIATALLAGTRADAAPWTALTPTDAQSRASGKAKVDGISFAYRYTDPYWPGGVWMDVYSGRLSVRCRGLNGSAMYTVWADSIEEGGVSEVKKMWTFTTDSLGEGGIVDHVLCFRRYAGWVEVYVEKGILVLSGYLSR